jgi:site-specific recombinase XerC
METALQTFVESYQRLFVLAGVKKPGEFLFAGRRGPKTSITTRQYARLVSDWIGNVRSDPKLYGTDSLRRTEATLIYRRTGNLGAVQLLLGHTKTRRHPQISGHRIDDALAIAEQVVVGRESPRWTIKKSKDDGMAQRRKVLGGAGVDKSVRHP